MGDIGTMNLLEENLKVLKVRYPELAERIINLNAEGTYTICGSGSKNAVNIVINNTGKLYYDAEDPVGGIRAQLDSLEIKNAKVAVFLGFGLGLELDVFAREYAEKAMTRAIVVIEKDVELFRVALSLFDYRPLFMEPKIKLIVGVPSDDLLPIFTNFFIEESRIMFSKAIVPIYMETAYEANREYYLKTLKALGASVPFALRYIGNSPEDSLIGIENMLLNLGEIIKNPGINTLYNKFKGRPAIVVATGPSLNKNKHLLKDIGNRALILSVDASLRILLEAGVKPHLVTSLERIPETAELMSGFQSDDVKDVYFAACPVVPNEAYKVYPGPRIIVYRNFDHFRWIEIDKGILEIMQSSGNMAFKIAETLGCDPIILVGQDLAYARDGKSHALGSLYGEEQFQYKNTGDEGRLWVMGNDGEPIQTHSDWDEFRKAYEIDISKYHGTCINATEGGARINGTEIMTLEAAISKYMNEEFSPLTIIKDALMSFTVENEKEDIVRVRGILKNTCDDLKRMQEICIEGIEPIHLRKTEFEDWLNGSKIKSEEFSQSIHILLQDTIQRKKDILSIQPTMQLFLMHIWQSYFIKHEMDCHEIPGLYTISEEIEIRTILLHLRLFGILHEIIRVCLESLVNAEKMVERIGDEL